MLLHQGLKQLDSKMCGTLKQQEAERMKQTALQDPAFTAENSHRDWLPHCREDWRSSCSHFIQLPSCKERVLTTQRARKAQYNFGGEFHPDLQQIGNTEKARLLEVDVDSGGRNGQFLFPFDGLIAQTIPQGSGGNTFNEHHATFFTKHLTTHACLVKETL